MRELLKKFITKIKQAHCRHNWEYGFILFELNKTATAGELVSTDDGVCKGCMKKCKKCDKWEDEKDVKVFGQIIGMAR